MSKWYPSDEPVEESVPSRVFNSAAQMIDRFDTLGFFAFLTMLFTGPLSHGILMSARCVLHGIAYELVYDEKHSRCCP